MPTCWLYCNIVPIRFLLVHLLLSDELSTSIRLKQSVVRKPKESEENSLKDLEDIGDFYSPRSTIVKSPSVDNFEDVEDFSTPRSSLSRSQSYSSFNSDWQDTMNDTDWQDATNETAKLPVPLNHLDIRYSMDSTALERAMKDAAIGEMVGLVDTEEDYFVKWAKFPDFEVDGPNWMFRAYAKTETAMDEIGLVKYSISGIPAQKHDYISRRCTPDTLRIEIDNVFVNNQWKGLGNCKPLFYWAVKDLEKACQKDVDQMWLTFAAFDDPLPACACYAGAGNLLGFTQLSLHGKTYAKQDAWDTKDQIKEFCRTHFLEAEGQIWTFRK